MEMKSVIVWSIIATTLVCWIVCGIEVKDEDNCEANRICHRWLYETCH